MCGRITVQSWRSRQVGPKQSKSAAVIARTARLPNCTGRLPFVEHGRPTLVVLETAPGAEVLFLLIQLILGRLKVVTLLVIQLIAT